MGHIWQCSEDTPSSVLREVIPGNAQGIKLDPLHTKKMHSVHSADSTQSIFCPGHFTGQKEIHLPEEEGDANLRRHFRMSAQVFT